MAEIFPGCEVTLGSSVGDQRSYRVSFEKIAGSLPGYRGRWTARNGAEELRTLFERIEMSPDTHAFRAFKRLKQIQYLQRTRQVDNDLYWRAR